MPTNTPNISLAKPLVNEKYDVDILNENFDKLDLAMAGAIDSSDIAFTPTGNLSSTNVQNALAELDSEKANKEDVNIITDDFKKYKIVSGVIRHDGTSWSILNDSEHTSINIASVTNDTSDITINYGFTATKVVSFIASQDETFNLEGYLFGCSVGVSLSKINIFKTSQTIGGLIVWNGSAWNFSSTKGVTGVSFSSGIMTITHAYMDDYICNATTRDGVYITAVGSLGTTTTQIKFLDYAGNSITTPDTNMKFYFERSRTSGKANPQTTNIAGANIWIFGIFEVA